jgi:hypothetical protein
MGGHIGCGKGMWKRCGKGVEKVSAVEKVSRCGKGGCGKAAVLKVKRFEEQAHAKVRCF